MKTIITTLIFFFSIQLLNAQSPRDFISGFFQKIDISAYQGGEFQLSVDIKVETFSEKSAANFFVRIDDNEEHMMLYDSKGPIKKNEWETYNITGKIHKKGHFILVGGQCVFKGKYYYKNFKLKVKNKSRDWQTITFALEKFKPNQENHPSQNFTNPINCKIIVQHKSKNEDYLLLDASQIIYHGLNKNTGKFVKVNGVNLYYETYGEGEPLLLVHGNSQSIKDFAAQIPVLAN